MNTPVLELQQVGVREGARRRARWPLRNLDLVVAKGDVLGVAGIGKSLLLELACGWRAPDEGRVLIDGYVSLRLPSAVSADVVWLGEGLPRWPRLKVLEALSLQSTLHAGTQNKAELYAALETVGLAGRAATSCRCLTADEMRRLQLALLWMCSPRLVLIDAAVLNVDDTLTEAVCRRIQALAQAGTAFVLAVVEPRWAEACKRLLWLPEGRGIDAEQMPSLKTVIAAAGRDRALSLAHGISARVVSGEPGAVRLVAAADDRWPEDVEIVTRPPTLGDAFVWQATGRLGNKVVPERSQAANEFLLRLALPGLREIVAGVEAQDELHLRNGEIAALTGDDAGELLAALAEGRRVDGVPVEVLGHKRADFALRSRIGYLPPQPPAQMDYPAQAWLGWRAGVFGVSVKQASAQILDWSQRFGLQAALSRPWETLRFAEKRLLQILAAWFQRPALVLLDRPFAGLDPRQSEILRFALLEWAAQGAGVVYHAGHRGETWFADRAYALQSLPAAGREVRA